MPTELRDELTELGADVTIAACDVADREQVAAVLADLPADQPLTAVVHTAGVLADGVLEGAYAATVRRPCSRPRSRPRRCLDELTRDLDLDAFVLFSSVAGTVGNPGQGNYAAANAVLDALAQRRRSLGLAATSIAWGAWAGSRHGGRRQRRVSSVAMDPELAIAALRQVVTEPAATVVVAALRQEAMLSWLLGMRPSPTLADLPGARRILAEVQAARRDTATVASGFQQRLGELGENERTELVLDLVRGPRSPPCSRTPARPRSASDSAFRGPRVRLADRGGAAQPAHLGHRARAARDASSSTTRRRGR